MSQEAADPDGALQRLRCAERLADRAVVPLRMAVVYERLGKPAEAADAFERYLALAGKDAPDRREMRERIRRLRQPVDPKPAASTPAPDSPPAPSKRPLIGWITAGTGLAMIMTGSVLLASAASTNDELQSITAESNTPWNSDQGKGTYDSARTRQTWGAVLLGVGAAATGVGTWLLLTPHGAQAGRVQGAGLSWSQAW